MATDRPMQLGMVGLGRMGANLVRRLTRDGHRCVAYDRKPDVVKSLEAEGASGANSYEELARKLDRPRNIWIMIPAAAVQSTLDQLVPLLDADDIVIDGGNSYYRDDITRAAALRAAGIHYVDVGTSGGVWGLKRGYCLMIGGQAEAVQRLDPIFKTLAPGVESAEPTPSRTRADGTAPDGYLHCGPKVVGSWLVDLAADAFARSPDLDGFGGRVSDSGEGRWTVLASVEEGVPATVITTSLYERFESRQAGEFTDKILSAMRSEFGGHSEKAR